MAQGSLEQRFGSEKHSARRCLGCGVDVQTVRNHGSRAIYFVALTQAITAHSTVRWCRTLSILESLEDARRSLLTLRGMAEGLLPGRISLKMKYSASGSFDFRCAASCLSSAVHGHEGER